MKWEFKKLGDVCEFQGGSQPPKSTFSYIYQKGYVRLIQIRDYKTDKHIVYIPKEKAKRFCNPDDIMIGRYGPPVFQILRGLEGAYNVALMKAIPNEKILSKDYLFHFLQTPAIQNHIINLSSRAAGQSGVNKQTLNPYPIPIPPLEEQKRIVGILDESFEAIALAEANTKKNLANARELFDSYLNRYFDNHLEYVDFKQLNDVVMLARGQNPPKSTFVNSPQEGYVRFYQIRDGHNDKYEVYVPDNHKLHKVKPHEILMVAYRHIGRCFRGADGAFNVALCKLTTRDEIILSNDYLFHLIPSKFIRDELMKRSERSLIPSMSIKDLEKLKIPVPSRQEQDKICNSLNEIKNYAEKLEGIYQRKLEAFTELKQSILQKAFTGQLTQ